MSENPSKECDTPILFHIDFTLERHSSVAHCAYGACQ